MAHKGFQLGLEMPALLRGIATINVLFTIRLITTFLILKCLLYYAGLQQPYNFVESLTKEHLCLEMPALLRGIATVIRTSTLSLLTYPTLAVS